MESRRDINLQRSHRKPKLTNPAVPQGAGLSPSLLSKPRSHFSCEPPPELCTSSCASGNHSSHASRAPASHGRSPHAVAWPVAHRLGTSAPVAPGKQTTFRLGLFPCATAATFSRLGCAGSTAGRVSKVQPRGCSGLRCQCCCHCGCHRSWRRAGLIQPTRTAWRLLRFGSRVKLPRKPRRRSREGRQRSCVCSWAADSPAGGSRTSRHWGGEAPRDASRSTLPRCGCWLCRTGPVPATGWREVTSGWRGCPAPLHRGQPCQRPRGRVHAVMGAKQRAVNH